jgi:pSer/pThr/pTyr-binding forkhead associated (FHA) protein/RNase H-fold protein (predicted Holliday junction resolvase)
LDSKRFCLIDTVQIQSPSSAVFRGKKIMQVVLRIENSKSNVRQLRLKSETTVIGRGAGCQLKVVSDQISRRHCQITVLAQSVTIQDLGSVNGTFVNGGQIEPHAEVQLSPGTQVRLGSLQFIVEFQLNKSSIGGDGSSTILSAEALKSRTEATTDIFTASELNESTASSSTIDFSAPSGVLVAADPHPIAAVLTASLLPISEAASIAEPVPVAETLALESDLKHEPEPESLQIVDFDAAAAVTAVTATTVETALAMTAELPVNESTDELQPPIEIASFADAPRNSNPQNSHSVNPISVAIVVDDSSCVAATPANLSLTSATELVASSEETPSGIVATNSVAPDKLSTTENNAKADAGIDTKSDQAQFEELMFELTPLALLRSAADPKMAKQGTVDPQTDRVSNTLLTPEVTQSVLATATVASESSEAMPTIADVRPVKRALVPILGMQRNSQVPTITSNTAKQAQTEVVVPSASQSAAFPRLGHLLGVACASNRVGYAVCNSDQTIASLIENASQTETIDVQRVRKLVLDNHVVGLVLSLPPLKGGSETPKSLECRQLAETLSLQTGLPVTFAEDNSASRFAAQVMLQRFLEGRRAEKTKGPTGTRVLTEC